MREFNVYAEMLPCTQKIAELSWKPKGIILSGGPYSVYAEDALMSIMIFSNWVFQFWVFVMVCKIGLDQW